ncbi:hypothetical protein EV175_001293 [Coemansia sp. RSA 1933]|nr:hypothetical protein EV175_001293 [Coemansia sp. RSA 1933]
MDEEEEDEDIAMRRSESDASDDENYEYVEKEYFVVASLPGNAISNAQSSQKQNEAGDSGDQEDTPERSEDSSEHVPKYAIIDVDTERPMLEIEGTIYQGVHDELLGSSMLFDIGADSSESRRADLVGTTSRVIHFHPVKFHKR